MNIERGLASLALSLQGEPKKTRDSVAAAVNDGTLSPIINDEPLAAQFQLVLDSAVGNLGQGLIRYTTIQNVSVTVGERCLPGGVLLTVDQESGFVALWLSLDMGSGDHIDDSIAISHSLFGTESNGAGLLHVALDGSPTASLREALLRILSRIFGDDLVDNASLHDFRLFELRGQQCLFETDDPSLEPPNCQKEVYGLLTGDEGWRDVPTRRATRAIGEFWSSREFLQVTAYGSCVVAMNTKSQSYSDRAEKFFHGYFGNRSGYFQQKYDIGGLDCGVLFACENVLERIHAADTIIAEIREQHLKRSRVRDGRLPESQLFIREVMSATLQSARLRVQNYLEKLRDTDIVEVGDMLELILERSGVHRLEVRVHEYSDMMDDELDRLGTFQLARLGLFAALIGLLFAVTNILLILKII